MQRVALHTVCIHIHSRNVYFHIYREERCAPYSVHRLVTVRGPYWAPGAVGCTPVLAHTSLNSLIMQELSKSPSLCCPCTAKVHTRVSKNPLSTDFRLCKAILASRWNEGPTPCVDHGAHALWRDRQLAGDFRRTHPHFRRSALARRRWAVAEIIK